MLKSYFQIAWRSINRYRAYSIINILGLALGIASCLIIFLVVRNELSYDTFHRKADRIYRVTLNAIDFNPNVSMAIVPAMRNDFPELENISQVWYNESGLVKVGQVRYQEKGYAFADKQFPSIFDYKWIGGDPQTALVEPNSIVLTETIARKYFGQKEAIGQVINLDNQYDLKVTGLIRDLPGNTHLPFVFLVSLETLNKGFLKEAQSNFYQIMGGSLAYIVIPENYSIQQLQKRMPAFIEKNWGKDIAKEARLPLQPLKEIHFDQRYLNNTISPTTSRETYWALSAVAVFIIVIGCINFINLATAQAMRRAREVGVRKVLGSTRSQLIFQFLGETALLVLVAVLLSLMVVALFLPQVSTWLNIKISRSNITEPTVMALLGAIMIVVILLAGLYPAFVQSAFRPVDSLKSKISVPFRGFTLRKSLVVVQFAISQMLIVGTLVVAYQMDFFQNRDLGFNKEAVISFEIPNPEKREALRQQLTNNPGIKEFSFSSGAPVYNHSFTSFSSAELGVTKDDVTEMKFIDEKYTDLFELKMLAGQKVSKANEKDTVDNVVINEVMMQKLGIQDPQQAIGKQITLGGNPRTTIMGVVKDFQSESKHKKRRSCVLVYRSNSFYMASVKIQPAGVQRTIDQVDKAWSALFPENYFDYEFLDDRISSFYRQEQKMYTAFKLFSIIAIVIGCLGLYGLVAFSVMQRTKEVGIRKVLGASLFNIVSLLTKEFLRLIAFAFLIAAPIAYYTMHLWLGSFAYQVTVGGWIFGVSLAISCAIAAITIGYQALKAAIANPVKSLKTE
jgi:ABC-type antimicrobial peptide transport system permease subunit